MNIILLTQERGDPVLINSDWIVHATRIAILTRRRAR
jgi:hypothetical protein